MSSRKQQLMRSKIIRKLSYFKNSNELFIQKCEFRPIVSMTAIFYKSVNSLYGTFNIYRSEGARLCQANVPIDRQTNMA